MANACVACVKYLMFAFNFLFWLCGCALLGLGLFLCFEPTMRDYANSSGDLQEYYIALYCLIGIGGLMMLVGFLGCCGACAENRVLLGLFFVFLLLICVVEVGGGFYAYMNKNKLEDLIITSMTDAMNVKYPEEPVKSAVDNMQQQLECCGSTSAAIWLGPRNNYGFIPASCCVDEGCVPPTALEVVSRIFSDGSNVIIYTEGCATKLFNILNQNVILLAGLTIGIGIVQLLGMIFSCCLCIAIGRQDDDKGYI